MMTKLTEMTSDHASPKRGEDFKNMVHKLVELSITESRDGATGRRDIGAYNVALIIHVLGIHRSGGLYKTVLQSSAADRARSYTGHRC
jgi:hypothetical protein